LFGGRHLFFCLNLQVIFLSYCLFGAQKFYQVGGCGQKLGRGIAISFLCRIANCPARFAERLARYRQIGQDFVVRDAPCLVVAMVDQDFLPMGRDNTHFTLAYAQLYAPSIGLGTCMTGFFNECSASGYRPLLDILKLPENMFDTSGLMVGYPIYAYRRLVDRKPLQITWQ
jgi:nitroreductase